MTPLEQKARDGLLSAFAKTGGRYIPPSWPHYPWQWAWDSFFHAIICAHVGLLDLAKNEITRLLSVQVSEGYRKGFIPHQIYWPKVNGFNKRGWMDWERLLYRGWMPLASPLPAQPVLAQAVRAINDTRFFLEYADAIIDFYQYYARVLDHDNDGLVSIFSPRAGGRDSSPEFDFFRISGLRAPKHKTLDILLDATSIFWLELRYKLMGWDERRIFESKIFDVQDIAIQCIYIDGLYDLAWMMEQWDGSRKRWPAISAVIKHAERAVLDKCWNEEDQTFYSLRNGKEQLRELTISSIFPLVLKNVPQTRKEAILKALKDKKKFNTPYAVPSVAVSHPAFDATSDWPLWRGPTWQNMNWFIIRWLLQKGERDLAWRIAEPSIRVAEKDLKGGGDPFPEFRDPFTGEGLRNKGAFKVANFGWAKLLVTFRRLFDDKQKSDVQH